MANKDKQKRIQDRIAREQMAQANKVRGTRSWESNTITREPKKGTSSRGVVKANASGWGNLFYTMGNTTSLDTVGVPKRTITVSADKQTSTKANNRTLLSINKANDSRKQKLANAAKRKEEQNANKGSVPATGGGKGNNGKGKSKEVVKTSGTSVVTQPRSGQRRGRRYLDSTPAVSRNITIRRGDTLSSIARRYGTTVEQLAKDNNISDINSIIAGQTLNIGRRGARAVYPITRPTINRAEVVANAYNNVVPSIAPAIASVNVPYSPEEELLRLRQQYKRGGKVRC